MQNVQNVKYPKGSEWRRWDLHVHTASSYDYEYKDSEADNVLCEALKENNIAAVAITDHFTIDKARIENLRKLAPEIVFFPGVELRTDKGDTNIHVILIFDDNNDNVNFDNLIEDFNVFKRNAQNPDDDNRIYWDFKDIVKFAEDHSALITVHAGSKSAGIDKEITSRLEINQAVKTEYSDYVDIFEMGKASDLDEYRDNVFPTIGERPMIICSDCHDARDYNNRVKEFLWIKADPTFEGLLQCIHQPTERVYVGTIPPSLEREQKSKRSIISNIFVKRIDKHKHPQYNWLDVDLPLNSGLTAIIGNKGSGKSALSDIIGHMCDCSTMGSASFLNDTRFRKLPNNYADDYEATITWADSHQKKTLLSNHSPSMSIESAQYLPQRYIEEICNDTGDVFQTAIDKVIFSYVDKTERSLANNLPELVESKSSAIKTNITKIQSEIDNINAKIIRLEERKTRRHKNHVEENIKKLKEDLKRHIATRPNDVSKPESKETDNEYQRKIFELSDRIENIEDKIGSVEEQLTDTNVQIDEIEHLLAKIESLHGDVISMNKEILCVASRYGLNDIVTFSEETPKESIVKSLKTIKSKKQELQIELNGSDHPSDEASSDIGLLNQLELVKGEKEQLIATADSGEKNYQKYLADLKHWEKEKLSIEGNTTEEDTLAYFEAEKNFLDNELDAEYANAVKEREDKTTELFDTKLKFVSIYQEIYSPIENEIKKLLSVASGEEISFVAEVQLRKEPNIAEELLGFIDKKFYGKYKTNAGAASQMDRDIKATEFDKIESVLAFAKCVMEVTTEDFDKSAEKISNKLEFYNRLYSLDYIDVAFQLKVGGRVLDELSPGERGIVLLIFFLALSQESIPIIIDQPEDNLDNQSIYEKLVPCICEAKKKRQVIIVTHNPNIAIACDAEQIICCKIDKKSNSIRYESGAIENQQINKHVVDILEGTKPAFNLRKRKYANIE